MKIKNSEIVEFLNGVSGIKEKRLPVKVGYAINKNIRGFEDAAVAYEEERRKILDKYLVLGADGKPVDADGQISYSDENAYVQDINELLSIENEIDIQQIDFSELEKCDSEQFDSLSIKDISMLEFMTK
ncbi:hypothetical protein [Murimonas intestini]|uniref:hypothetical protein n=1 Tax=Murimonas intestini TaxID=1337051 RepID=UPI00248CDE16|nr:hypothetical protein [Murimonas intestini]